MHRHLRADWSRLRRCTGGSGISVSFDLPSFTVAQPLERQHSAGGALAPTDASFPAHLNLKDGFVTAGVLDDLHVAEFEPGGLVRPQPGIRHEQHIVVRCVILPEVLYGWDRSGMAVS